MEDSLNLRIRALLAQDASLGYRAVHGVLKQEAEFQEVSLKKVQTAMQQVRAEPAEPAEQAASSKPRAGPGENLWTAASDGDVARVDELMALEGFTPSSQDENGYTPVMAAASWGHAELLKILLERDAGAVNVADTDGDTPLHHVAQAEELEEEQVRSVLQLLLAHKADPNLQNNDGKTCLELCGRAVLEDEEMETEEAEEPPALNMNFIKVMDEHGVKLE
eukprot:TRINITY_DN30898_c0_g1_i1.p1 TRINITY_DN30898_c0_g1~~TRINITY_DN30898_c0_g1_i1.p1  ORF type:complete len:242 (+),score=62.05 TRINITY_DN30898_c0_g1_i1:64-726(+)